MNRIGGSAAAVGVLAMGLLWLALALAAAQAQENGGLKDGLRLYRENCQLIDDLSPQDEAAIKAKPKGFVLQVQRGVRSVYTAADFQRLQVVNPNRNLTDDRFGPQTQRALVAFCRDFPVVTLPTDMARWAALFASARHFDVVSNQDRRDWRSEVSRPQAVAALGEAEAGDLRLRLAGPPSAVLQLLGDGSGLQTQPAPADVCAPVAAIAENKLAPYTNILRLLLGAEAYGQAGSPAAAARAFCIRYRVSGSRAAAANDTLEALTHYGELQAIHAQAITTIMDGRFGAWVTEQGEDPLPYHRLLRLAGSVPVVAALLAEYGESKPEDTGGGGLPDDGLDLPPSCSLTAGARYFDLTAADFKAIAGRDKLAANVAKLAGTQARSMDAAVAMVDQALPGLDACNRDYARHTLAADANQVPVFELVDNGFANGPLFALPDNARQQLQALAKLPPPATRSALTQQIDAILADALQQKAAAAAARYGAAAAARAVPAQPAAPAPAAGGASGIGAGNEPGNGSGNGSGDDASGGATASGSAAGTGASSPAASPTAAPAPPQVTLPDSIASDLASDGVPAAAAQAAAKLAGQPFAAIDDLTKQVTLAIASALAKAEAGQLTAFQKAVAAQIRQTTVVAFTDQAMADLQRMPALHPVGAPVLQWVQPLQDVSFASHALFEAAANNPLNTDTAPPPGLATAKPYLTLAARKTPAVAPDVDPLALTVPADCGCVPWDLKADRDVYGFYPFWTAPVGEQAAPPPAVDLSLFSRVAYFGARAGAAVSGSYAIVDWAGWQPAQDSPDGGGAAGFVENVHRHNGKADLAVFLDQWADHAGAADDLATMAEAVAQRSLPPPGFWSAVWQMIVSQGAANGFLEAPLDGVTLYFPDLADVAIAGGPVAAAQKITAVAKAFRKALPASMDLNIAFAMPVSGAENLADRETVLKVRERVTLLYMGLAPMIGGSDREDAGTVDLVLVMLNRPTTESKKVLVRGIQDAFAGEVRRAMLRKTVAVIAPNGHKDIYNRVPELANGQRKLMPEQRDYSQYEDDLSYFRDNLRGAGFWPMPTAADAGYATVAELLRQRFWTPESDVRHGDTAEGGFVGQALAALAPLVEAADTAIASVAETVCTHRILFRLIAAVLLAGLVVLAVLSYVRCAICMGIARKLYIPPIGSLALAAVWALLAIFDPLFAPNVVAWLLALLPLALLYNLAFGYIFRMRRADDP